MRREHRLPYGRTFIGNVLTAAGQRDRRPRGRTPAPWSKGTFRKLFPGAQWLGDGTTIAIRVNGRCFTFNVEAMHDPASDALVGVTVGDTEDEQAVIDTFRHGETTTGDQPVALTLDNRPSNLTAGVVGAIAPTALLPSTPGRGESKAPLEGNFGLFQQTAPPLVVRGKNLRELARSVLALTMTLWAWARNGRPRSHLGGRSPRDVYQQDRPSEDQIEQARDWILELRRRAERARLTRDALADPVRRELLDRGLADLGIPDPDGRIARSLARYGIDAITRGLATFSARLDRSTLPPDLAPDSYHRFLGGIIRQLDTRFELERVAQTLLEQRIRLRDISLGPLLAQVQQIRDSVSPAARPQAYVDRALDSEALIDFRFWARCGAAAIGELPSAISCDLYRQLARRIAATFKADRERRADLIDQLSRAVTETA